MALAETHGPPAEAAEILRALADRSETKRARTLPTGSYCSEEIFAVEVQNVFRAGWINVGHVSLLPEPGDFRCVDVVGEPLVMVRGRDEELRVLSRICAHRWMEVCSGTGHTRLFECSYHRCTYNLDGRLRSAPFMKRTPGFNDSEVVLPRIRHEVWEGFIYVNLDGQAESTATLWSDLSTQLRSYALAEWKVVSTIDWGRCPWDWKVFMDNGECYHHLGAHRRTLEPLLPTRTTQDLPTTGTSPAFPCPTTVLTCRRVPSLPGALAGLRFLICVLWQSFRHRARRRCRPPSPTVFQTGCWVSSGPTARPIRQALR